MQTMQNCFSGYLIPEIANVDGNEGRRTLLAEQHRDAVVLDHGAWPQIGDETHASGIPACDVASDPAAHQLLVENDHEATARSGSESMKRWVTS